MYGDKIKTEYRMKTGLRVDVIGEVTIAPAGNLVLRVGRLLEDGRWERTAHIVMTPAEVEEFINEIALNMESAERNRLARLESAVTAGDPK
jgi:hypothetical protein